ncbi:MAG: metallo-beta-lactamase class [Rhizorhabdus sp.]|nr:metallo-beta-lactamase class [Rhizorhabdus sp.]
MRSKSPFLLLAAAAMVPLPTPASAHSPFEPPEIQANVDEATRLARTDLAAALFFCEANPTAKVTKMLKEGINDWFEPTRIFDNLSYIGNHFVGVFALETDGGLILFDSGTSLDDAEKHIAPGLAKLGLDPKNIKYIVVTHGHWDHFGGALWFQDTYKTPVGLSEIDWKMIERQEGTPILGGHPIPRRDQVITDGQTLKVGSTSVKLYITPGHTPGTVSAIFTAKQGGKSHVISLLGSTAFPGTIEPTDITGGLARYRESIARFSKISRQAGADGLLNTHLFAFGGDEKLARTQASGNGNAFLIGADGVARFYGLLDHCMQASEARIRAGRAGPGKVGQ